MMVDGTKEGKEYLLAFDDHKDPLVELTLKLLYPVGTA